MSRKNHKMTTEEQEAQAAKIANDLEAKEQIEAAAAAAASKADEKEQAPALEWESETPLIFNFIEWAIGEAHALRFAGLLKNPDDSAIVPGVNYIDNELCERENGAYRQMYLFEKLNSQYKPTGAFLACNQYWHLQEFFIEKINEMGQDLSRYPLQITLIDEVQKKGQQPIKIFDIKRAKTPTLDICNI